MDLTNELRQSGWKPIGEVMNEPDDGIYYILEPRPHSAFLEHAPRVTKKDLLFYMRDYPVKKIFYRRLIPALPNQVVISRGDAEAFIEFAVNGGALYSDESVCLLDTAVTRLRAKLEGK